MDEVSLDALKQKIVENFTQSGYPFEAKVARSFRNLQMKDDYEPFLIKEEGDRPIADVQCGVPYADSDTGESRELDVSVTYPFRLEGLDFWLHFQVQCKSTNSVWSFGHYGFEIHPTIHNKFILSNVSFKKHEDEIIYRLFLPDPIVFVDPAALCSVGRVLSKKGEKPDHKDEVLESSITAVKSMTFMSKLMREGLPAHKTIRRIDFLIPMVATSNLLFQLDLSRDEEPTIQDTDRIFYLQRSWNAEGNVDTSIVPIVTETSLEEIVNQIIANSFGFVRRCFLE